MSSQAQVTARKNTARNNHASPVPVSYPDCPSCKRRMSIRQVSSVLFASGLDDVVYACERCGTEAKRTVKRA